MTQTIYVLTEGSYYDYHIIGVYSTEKLAEEAKEFAYPYADVEEYALNQIPDHPPGMKAWYVRFCNGTLNFAIQASSNYFDVRENEYIQEVSKYNPERKVFFDVYCWAVDKEHAEKIALDKYYQHQAQKSGIA